MNIVPEYNTCVTQIKQSYAGAITAAAIKIGQCANGGQAGVPNLVAEVPASRSAGLDDLRNLLEKFMKYKF